MAKREEVVLGITEAKMIKQDCEQALKKIDEGIKWSGYAFLALIAMAVCMAAASIDGIIGALFGILMIAAFGAYVVCMVLAIAKGGGLGRVLKTAGKIAKWAYYLIPFVFIDIFVAIYVVIVAFAMYLTMPIVFFFIIKHSLKKDLKAANAYIAMYEAEAAKMN